MQMHLWAAHHKKIMGIQFHPEYYHASAKEFYSKWVEWCMR